MSIKNKKGEFYMASMLTKKEAELISDLMVIEENAYKKSVLYSRLLTDADICEKLKTVSENHKVRLLELFKSLGGKV